MVKCFGVCRCMPRGSPVFNYCNAWVCARRVADTARLVLVILSVRRVPCLLIFLLQARHPRELDTCDCFMGRAGHESDRGERFLQG